MKQTNDYYVYTHAYPESMGGAVFYVGKGSNGRIDQHESNAKNGSNLPQCQIIREIWDAGEQVVKKKVHENLTSKQACTMEREVMHSYGLTTLSNKRYLGGTSYAFLCLPKTLALSVLFREQLSHLIEDCMRNDDIELTPENCKEYLGRAFEQSLISHLTQGR